MKPAVCGFLGVLVVCGFPGPAKSTQISCISNLPRITWGFLPQEAWGPGHMPRVAIHVAGRRGRSWHDQWGHGPYPWLIHNPYVAQQQHPMTHWPWARQAPLRIVNPYVDPGDVPAGLPGAVTPRRPQVIYPAAMDRRPG
jgi:hypothetical protein